MAISMVRKPSETPNITNIDDIIPFRYAYGNQNGYVIGKGAEVSHTVNGNQFTVNSGRLVIQGVESDIDSNGITLTIDSVSETRYYVVYHEINLGTNTANIKVQFDTATYPNITDGDDLTANSSGIANLVLYRFIAVSGVISSVEKIVKEIKHSLQFNVDKNDVLKFGNEIISRKKLIMENLEGVTEYTFNEEQTKIEIIYSLGGANKKSIILNLDTEKISAFYEFGRVMPKHKGIESTIIEMAVIQAEFKYNPTTKVLSVDTIGYDFTDLTYGAYTLLKTKIHSIYEIIE